MRQIIIPESLISNIKLTPSDVIIYGILLHYSYKDHKNHPVSILKNKEIATATNFSERTISQGLKRLNENGIIKIDAGKCFFANQTIYRKIYPQLF